MAERTNKSTFFNLFVFICAVIKEERFRYGSGYDQVEDVIGVAQPVRFNSKRPTLLSVGLFESNLHGDHVLTLVFSVCREMSQRVASLRENSELLQSVPEERELLAGCGYVSESQRLVGHVCDQRGAAVHTEDRGGL